MTGAELRRAVTALPGVDERPHFDRAAFRVKRQFLTLAADERSANLLLSPDEQAHYCALFPDAFAPVPNKWGARGWTTVVLAHIAPDDFAGPLRAAWRQAGGMQ